MPTRRWLVIGLCVLALAACRPPTGAPPTATEARPASATPLPALTATTGLPSATTTSTPDATLTPTPPASATDEPLATPDSPTATTLAPTHSATPVPPTPQPSPTTTSALPSATPQPPTATPSATPTQPPAVCANPWFMDSPPAGCPDQPVVYALTIAQDFERGLLLWRAQPDNFGSQIYAFFTDGEWPLWNPTNDRWRPGLPESDPSIVPPAGMYQPVRGFGLFWRDANFVPAGLARDRLGWATEPERGIGEQPLQCLVQSKWADGCYMGAPDGLILVIEGNNVWRVWTGPP